MPNGRCRMHGGKSTGPKTLTAGGRFSKFLPRRLAARYEEARQDAELIALSDDLAVLEARLCELLGTLDAADSAAAWKQAFDLWAEAKEAAAAGDRERREQCFRQLDALLAKGLGEAEKWREIAGVIEQRRRLSETEGKRLSQMQQFITAQQANLLVAALIRVVQEHVPDSQIRTRIAVELARILDRPASRGADLH